MKTSVTFLLLAVLSITHTARAADSALKLVLGDHDSSCFELKTVDSSLELVLSDDHVVFTTATNISMEMIFRNVGETNMNPYDLLVGLSVVVDGKEYKRDPKQFVGYNGVLIFQPKHDWRVWVSFSEYLIPPEVLAFGRHTVALRDEGSESNTQTIFIEPQNDDAGADRRFTASGFTPRIGGGSVFVVRLIGYFKHYENKTDRLLETI
jgi:hypothetical protein